MNPFLLVIGLIWSSPSADLPASEARNWSVPITGIKGTKPIHVVS
jgi:hypothetical protein